MTNVTVANGYSQRLVEAGPKTNRVLLVSADAPTTCTEQSSPRGAALVTEAVLDAAARLFLTNDPSSVSMRRIASEAGVNYGLLHRHFGSKAELVAQVVRRHSDRFTPSESARDDAGVRLAEMAHHYLSQPAIARTLAWAATNEVDPAEIVAGLHDVDELVDALANALGDRYEAQLRFMLAASLVLGASVFEDAARTAAGLDATDRHQIDFNDKVLSMLNLLLTVPPTRKDPDDTPGSLARQSGTATNDQAS